ncbi:MAG: glycosyltransferase family 2 protein [Clostridia bacterium]|nr:glycosyltransferase family 2 protein [Clostridia bacterium]
MNGFSAAASVLSAISAIMGFLVIYKTALAVLGFITTKKYPAAKHMHKFAVLIAARNEERVIGQLIDSIWAQDYDMSRVTVFVAADNCTDDTAKRAREKGAVCYERFDDTRKTKGYALEFLVDAIFRDYGYEAFEGFFVFDADNILKRDYISRMNEAFDAGEKVITSYRNTKNFTDNWISASYALHWLRTARTEHRSRSVLGLSARVQGTGFLFARELVKDGWHYTSFTEDRAFSADAVVNGYHIAYNDMAQFYDEQPVDLKIVFRQRIRWAKGHLQSFTESGGKLFLGIFKKRGHVAYDMLWTVVPQGLISLFIRISVLILSICAIRMDTGAFSGTGKLFSDYMLSFWSSWFGNAVTVLAVLVFESRRMQRMPFYRQVFYCLLFTLFDLIGLISTVIALFMKVEWKPIPHTAEASLTDMEESIKRE